MFSLSLLSHMDLCELMQKCCYCQIGNFSALGWISILILFLPGLLLIRNWLNSSFYPISELSDLILLFNQLFLTA